MPRYSHLLEVKFNISDETQYYSGKSFYKKNMIDYVEVRACSESLQKRKKRV